jgi:hypothetical protein
LTNLFKNIILQNIKKLYSGYEIDVSSFFRIFYKMKPQE